MLLIDIDMIAALAVAAEFARGFVHPVHADEASGVAADDLALEDLALEDPAQQYSAGADAGRYLGMYVRTDN